MRPDIVQQIFHLAREVFGTDDDPTQIPPTDEYRTKLDRLHPSTTAFRLDDDGKVIGIALVVPTTRGCMRRFLLGEITERQLVDETKPQQEYDAVYLASVYVDPTYRRHGMAEAMTQEVLAGLPLTKDAPFFSWPFSDEGRRLAERLAHRWHRKIFQRPGRDGLAG